MSAPRGDDRRGGTEQRGRAVYFQRITPLNFLYGLWLSRTRRVLVWQARGLAGLARCFEELRPFEIFSRDEWLQLHEECFDLWRTEVFPQLMQRYQCRIRYRGQDIDFSRNLWQLLGADFERFYLFVKIALRHQQVCTTPGAEFQIMPSWICLAMGSELLSRAFPDARIAGNRLNIAFERLYEWGVTAAHLARALALFAVSLFSRARNCGPKPVFWAGISPSEIPERDGRLNFAWVTLCGYLKRSAVLYFLPVALTSRQRTYLEANGVDYVEPQALFRFVAFPKRTRAVLAALREFVSSLVSRSPVVGVHRARFAARALIWWELAAQHRARAYFTTASASWPERPEVAVMKASGVKTVTWCYSANSLSFTWHNRGFRDVGVSRSIIVADEYWVWNDAYRRWLENRQIPQSQNRCAIRAMGAMMCGDGGAVSLQRDEVRRQLGAPPKGYFISVFDMPTVSVQWRKRFGGGPAMIEVDFTEAFYRGVRRILECCPGVSILLKPKRWLAHWSRTYPESFVSLVEGKLPGDLKRRIHVLDADIDPYLPVAACDAALGIPFTSPVLLAASTGRPAAYFDPLGRVGYCPEPALLRLTIRGEDNLLRTVQSWTAGDARPGPDIGACYSPVPGDPLRRSLWEASGANMGSDGSVPGTETHTEQVAPPAAM